MKWLHAACLLWFGFWLGLLVHAEWGHSEHKPKPWHWVMPLALIPFAVPPLGPPRSRG